MVLHMAPQVMVASSFPRVAAAILTPFMAAHGLQRPQRKGLRSHIPTR